MALGEGMDTRQLPVSRLFRVRERAPVHRFPASVGMLGMVEQAGKPVSGKAMSLQVIGSVLAMEMRAVMSYWSPEKLANLPTVCMTQTTLRSAFTRVHTSTRTEAPTECHHGAIQRPSTETS